MKENQLDIPILLMIFNRPQISNQSFALIRKMRPKQFFICADGPRKDRPDDVKKCAEAREIAKKVDWPCEVKTLFQEENLGCGLGSVTGINWMFEQVDRGIIMDDDCLPDPSFFYFCQELLEKYKDNPKIMHVSGDNFQRGRKRGSASYYFSEYTHNWGWATWARAWKYNDFEMISPELRKNIWDKQWINSVKKQKGLAILPNINLVSNIGSGDDATHTTETSEYTAMKAGKMPFPLIHPKKIKRNILADYYTYRHVFGGKLRPLLFKKIKNILPEPIKLPARYIREILKKRKKTARFRKLYKKYREFTMIPERTFYGNLDVAMKFQKIKGVVVECGVWRGGMTAAMAEISGSDRSYHLFDSFEGLPEAKEIDGGSAISWQKNTGGKFYYDNCAAKIESAEQAMKLSGADKYRIIKGWFNETLPKFTPEPIAILRLDGDWYESTMECLDNLYKHVVAGGVIIVDDYYTWDGCAKAVHDFLSKNKLADRIYRSDKGVCYIIKN